LPAYIIYNVAKDLGGALALHEMLVYHGHPDFRDVINVIADRLEPAIRALNGYPAY